MGKRRGQATTDGAASSRNSFWTPLHRNEHLSYQKQQREHQKDVPEFDACSLSLDRGDDTLCVVARRVEHAHDTARGFGKVVGSFRPTGLRPTFFHKFEKRGVEMPPSMAPELGQAAVDFTRAAAQ